MTTVWKMLTHGKGWGEQEVRKHLDCMIAPKCSKFEAQTHNEASLHAWDHYSESVAEDSQNQERKVGLGGMEAEGRCRDPAAQTRSGA